jgi:hypothetical protein
MADYLQDDQYSWPRCQNLGEPDLDDGDDDEGKKRKIPDFDPTDYGDGGEWVAKRRNKLREKNDEIRKKHNSQAGSKEVEPSCSKGVEPS